MKYLTVDPLFNGGFDFSQIDEKEEENYSITVPPECRKHDIPESLEKKKFSENAKFLNDFRTGTKECRIFLQVE